MANENFPDSDEKPARPLVYQATDINLDQDEATIVFRYANVCFLMFLFLAYLVFSYVSVTLEAPNLGAAESSAEQINERALAEVFHNWSAEWGNGTEQFLASRLITHGTVKSSVYSLDTDKSQRSQAVLGCFDYAYTFVGVFTTSEMCILHVEHSKTGESWQLGRGPRYIQVLWKHLKRGDFKPAQEIAS